VKRLIASGCVLAALLPGVAVAGSRPRTPIRHVITLMQDNHSFDNYFGTYPGADGIPLDVCMPVDPERRDHGCVKPVRIGRRSVQDLSDDPALAYAQLRGGRMDGFVSAIAARRGRRQPLVMGHYDRRTLPFHWSVADEYVLFDRFFASTPGGSLANRLFWIGAGGRRSAAGAPASTIFDRLDRRRVGWKFYVENYRARRGGAGHGGGTRILRRFVTNRRRAARIVPLEQLLRDMQRGTLPAVSYVMTSASSERPPRSPELGQRLLRTLVNGLMRSRYWKSSAFMWTYDGWGGWYDHVRPPRIGGRQYGFRVPALLVSAYARRGHVEHATLDFAAVVKFIDRNWRLRPLTRRERRARGLMSAFDFKRPPRRAVFLSQAREAVPVMAPVRAPVYVSYGGALGVATLIILLALLHDAIRRRRAPHLRGPSTRATLGDRRRRR
jgi:phospholipase C